MPGDNSRASGIRALVRLDNGPLSSDDLTSLGLSQQHDSAICAVDLLESGAVHVDQHARGFAVLLGHIDESEDLAARLSLRQPPPLDLAEAAWAEFGDGLPCQMMGTWVFVRWDRESSQLIIAKSINPAYPMLVARAGPRIALAPELADLAQLDWVGDTIDPAALATTLIGFRMMPDPIQQTMLPAVRAINAGRVVRFDRHGESVKVVDPALPPAPWRGTFDDAVEESAALMRRLVGESMERAIGDVGVALSGGLDSTLLAWAAASERGSGASVPFFTSAVAPGRGDDETYFAQLVSDHLDGTFHRIVPPANADPYRPSVDHFRGSIRPTRLPHHFVSRAMADQAQASGVSHILFGVMGEHTLTASRLQRRWTDPARELISALRSRRSASGADPQWPEAAFSTWLTPELIGELPSDWITEHRRSEIAIVQRRRGEPFGYQPTMLSQLDTHHNEIARNKVRTRDTLTDIRLLRLFASMPASYADHGGLDRAIARTLLKGRVPDSIRLRPKGLPGAPDFHLRLREFAPAAKTRLSLFREAGIGAWLDLERLEKSLDTAAFNRETALTAFRAEFGMQIGEYLLWWLSGRPNELVSA